jgi:uncharacterized protein (DUF2249 family)
MAIVKHAAHATASEPITGEWKVSEVLQRYPDALSELIEISPAFSKLRNPLLRRVQSRLVTVEQAAQIADLDPAYLVRRLNAAVGIDIDESQAPIPSESPVLGTEFPWVRTAPIAEDLDVRPFQQRGEEPFSAIMAASRQVPVGQVLRLRNTFEPTPLYDVLGQRGFEHWARKLAENDWEVRFFNAGSARESGSIAPTPKSAPHEVGWNEPTSTLTIDVSELVPPEPMIRILSALEELPEGATLLVHHVRRPMHLYPRLDELGYRHETRDIGPAQVEVLIEKPSRSVEGAT